MVSVLALQTYHLTQLHPASAYQSCRLPWVLHFADKSSKEFQRRDSMNANFLLFQMMNSLMNIVVNRLDSRYQRIRRSLKIATVTPL